MRAVKRYPWYKIRPNFFLLSICILFLLVAVACGMRGDPVALDPRVESEMEGDTDTLDRGDHSESTKETMGETETTTLEHPDPPTGFTGVYTQNIVIVTWDEVRKPGLKLYRVYRSEGDDYELIGTAVTPAYIDRNVKPNMKYNYKVSAEGQSEGPLSDEIQIVTEGQ